MLAGDYACFIDHIQDVTQDTPVIEAGYLTHA